MELKHLIGIVLFACISVPAYSYQYISAAMNVGYYRPYMFCASQTTPFDAAVTSFSVKCAAQGPGYFYKSGTLTIPNQPLSTQTYGYGTYAPNVPGEHNIIGVHVFWTVGIPSGNLSSLDSINW